MDNTTRARTETENNVENFLVNSGDLVDLLHLLTYSQYVLPSKYTYYICPLEIITEETSKVSKALTEIRYIEDTIGSNNINNFYDNNALRYGLPSFSVTDSDKIVGSLVYYAAPFGNAKIAIGAKQLFTTELGYIIVDKTFNKENFIIDNVFAPGIHVLSSLESYEIANFSNFDSNNDEIGLTLFFRAVGDGFVKYSDISSQLVNSEFDHDEGINFIGSQFVTGWNNHIIPAIKNYATTSADLTPSEFDPPDFDGSGIIRYLWNEAWEDRESNLQRRETPVYPLPIPNEQWGRLFGDTSNPNDSADGYVTILDANGNVQAKLTQAEYEAELREELGLSDDTPLILLASVDDFWNFPNDLRAAAEASGSQSSPIVLTDQSKIPVLSDQSKFAPEGSESGVMGLDPDEYMANLQQGVPGGDGVYAEAGAEWLAGIMAQAGTEGQGDAAPGDPGPAGAEAGGDARLDAAYTSWQAAEQARLERESSLAAIESVHALTAAIESGDGVSMVRELVNSINAVDTAAMHRGHGSLFGEHGDLAHAGLSAVGNGLGLAQALQAGDNWSTVSGTAALVRDIDSFVQANGGSFLGDRGSAALGALGRVLNFGAALEGGDGYAIAASGLNLASDIGNYIDSGGTTLTLGPDAGAGLTALSGVASGASLVLDIRNLSDAFESGDARDIAISGGHTAVSAVNTYNAASQLAGGTGTTLGADLMPIVGYGASVLQLLDGDTAGAGMGATMTTGGVALSNAAAASTAASTAGTTAGTTAGVNAGATAGSGMSTATAGNVGAAVTAAVAVVELAEGEYADAAVDAVCAVLLKTGNGYCIAAAVVIQVVRALFFGHRSVPSASGSFVIDADGHAQLEGVYGGDEDLRDDAKEFGEALLPVIQSYVDSGGRAEIYGSLPTFVVKQGEPVKFEYLSADGVGKVSVLVEDSSRSGLELLGVLYARDRGASVEEALRVSTDASGDVDVARMDAILAGQGFVKRGLTYTYGETKSRECASWGTGVFQGGEQQGPVGETFVAKDEQVISLPLREEDLPGRQLGGILSARSLGGAFVDYGSGLFLLSLGGLLGGVAPAAGAQAGGPAGAGSGNASGPVVQPLDGYELSVYERLLSSGLSFAQSGQEAGGSAAVAGDFAGLAGLGGAELEAFLDRHWSELVRQGNVFSDLPRGSSYYHRGTVGAGVLHADGSRVATEPPAEAWWDEDWEQGPSSARGETLLDTVLGMTLGESSGGRQVRFGVWQALHESAPEPLPPDVEQGAFFITPQDSSLRFVESQLVHGVGEGFGLAAESLRFVGLGEAEHGRVYRDVNGDIRFEAEAGFTGQASFLYQVADALGNILTRRALVDVYDVNDAPLLADDTVRLGMDTPFALSGLLANDRDPEGDALHLDHFRGIDHGRVEERNGELFFVPDAGFTGAVEFSYFAYDRPGSYPGMARVRLTYENATGAPSLQDDQFLLLEDTELTFSADRLLANDQGQGLELLSVQGAAHGSVRLDADGTLSFIPDADYFGRDAGFSYTARSGTGVETSAWAGVAVLNVQDAPVVRKNLDASYQSVEKVWFQVPPYKGQCFEQRDISELRLGLARFFTRNVDVAFFFNGLL